VSLAKYLVVGGAGAYLAYVILRSDPADIPYVPTPGLNYVAARPAPLVPGTTYFGRASISWPLSMLVTASTVKSKLTSEGFTNITVWTDASDLPASWPAGERVGDIFVQATYPTGATATTMAVPSQVTSIWTA
jgi:hypothetical protein